MALSALTLVLQLGIVPLFIVWFFMIRRNAGLWGPQRRAQGWSIGAWFTPVVFLWFPFQIADDAWRASSPAATPASAVLPAATQRRGRGLIIGWWLCWLLAWFTGFHTTQTTRINADGTTLAQHTVSLNLGSTVVSNVFAAAAAVLGALMVRAIGQMQEARRAAITG